MRNLISRVQNQHIPRLKVTSPRRMVDCRLCAIGCDLSFLESERTDRVIGGNRLFSPGQKDEKCFIVGRGSERQSDQSEYIRPIARGHSGYGITTRYNLIASKRRKTALNGPEWARDDNCTRVDARRCSSCRRLFSLSSGSAFYSAAQFCSLAAVTRGPSIRASGPAG